MDAENALKRAERHEIGLRYGAVRETERDTEGQPLDRKLSPPGRAEERRHARRSGVVRHRGDRYPG